jgi:hypothetical protein
MTIFGDLTSGIPKTKYGAAKGLLTTAQKSPGELYSHFDYFKALLDDKNKIIKWTAIDVIGYMADVDSENKIGRMKRKLFSLLNSGELITANHAISALAQIAAVNPAYQEEITQELRRTLQLYHGRCRNIAGESYTGDGQPCQLEDKQPVIQFVLRQTEHQNATRKSEDF